MTNSIPRFWRRTLCMLYEFLLLLAVWFIASFIFHFVFRDPTSSIFQTALSVLSACLLLEFILSGSGRMVAKLWPCKPGKCAW